MIKFVKKIFLLYLIVLLVIFNSNLELAFGKNLEKKSKIDYVTNKDDSVNKDSNLSIGEKLKKAQNASVPFVKNEGQVENGDVLYYADIFSGKIFVTNNSLTYSLAKEIDPEIMKNPEQGKTRIREKEIKNSKKIAIKESFLDAVGTIKDFNLSGSIESETKVSYFQSNNKEDWRSDLTTFDQISLGYLWDNIEVFLNAKKNNVEKIFKVQPNGNPGDIMISTQGTDNISISEKGELVFSIGNEQISMTAPIAYQVIDGNNIDVPVNYKVIGDNAYSFEIGDYDRDKELIIDPLLAGTFLDYVGDYSKMAVAPDDSVYILGETESTLYPTTLGAYDTVYGGYGHFNGDFVIAHFNNDLTQLLSSTYLGGTDGEDCWTADIDFDSSGNVYISGDSSSANYPITAGAYDSTYNGGGTFDGDLVVSKLNGDLSQLLSSTYIGGSSGESGGDIIVDGSGNVFVSSGTDSADFPTTAGAANLSRDILYTNSVLVKLDNNLTTLSASTYVHGLQDTASLALDSNGNIFIAGATWGGLDNTAGSYDAVADVANGDVGIAKLNNNLSQIIISTYLGGSEDSEMIGVWTYGLLNVDGNDNVYVSSDTASDDFPTTVGAFDRTLGDYKDNFISKFDNNLSNLLASTYIGGANWEEGGVSVIDSQGNIYITSYSDSSNFYGLGDPLPIYNGAFLEREPAETENGADYIAKLDSNLSEVLASTYIGGTGAYWEFYPVIDLDSNDNVFFAVYTEDPEFPVKSDGYDTSMDSSGIALIKLDSDLSGNPMNHLDVSSEDFLFEDDFEDSFDKSFWNESFTGASYGADGTVYSVDIQSDSKIIFAGSFSNYNLQSADSIIRLNEDGSIDGSFSSLGLDGGIVSARVQSDGKIVMAGSFTNYGGNSINRIARLNSDGTLDGTFNVGTGFNSNVNTMELQPDGKIVVGGAFTSYNGTAINRIARLNTDGTLDATFNVGTGLNAAPLGVLVQSDGKIIAYGDFSTYRSVSSNDVVRINTDGTRDATFVSGTGTNNTIENAVVQPDGKIVIGGRFTTYNGTSKNRFARLNTNGTLDATFTTGTGPSSYVYALDIQSDGKIILGCGNTTSYSGVATNNSIRVNTDGTLDNTFTPSVDFGYASQIKTQSDGKIIFVGYASVRSRSYTYAGFVRYNPDGSEDTGFNVVVDNQFGWSIDNTEFHGGSGSLYSSGDSSSKFLFLKKNYNFPSDGEVSFWWKTNTDLDGYTALFFCLDKSDANCSDYSRTDQDARVNKVTGWEFVSIPVTAGAHDLTWYFDRYNIPQEAWIDDIKFSPLLDVDDVDSGVEKVLRIKAYDNTGGIYKAYEGDKVITFSGLSNSGGVPTCTDKNGNDISFGSPVTLNFIDGTATTILKAYTAETASINVTDGTFNSLGSSFYALDLTINPADPTSISPANSIISATPSPATQNQNVSITITSYDNSGNLFTTGGGTVAINISGSNTATPSVIDNGNGTYTASYMPVNNGVDQITATINGIAVGRDNDGVSDGTFNLIVNTESVILPEKEKDHITLIDSKDGKLTFDVKVSKNKEEKSKSIDKDDNESTEVRSVKIETDKNKGVEGEMSIKSKENKPEDVIFPEEINECEQYQIIDVDADFPDKNVKKAKINFRIPKGWLKKFDFENMVFVFGKRASTPEKMLTHNKWAIFLSGLLVKEDKDEKVFSVESKDLDGWWGVYNCGEEPVIPPLVENPPVETESGPGIIEEDIDEDEKDELAIDNNNDPIDGHEDFKDPDNSSDLIAEVDINDDDKTEFLVDTDKDNDPDVYWDPEEDIVSDVYPVDVDEDGNQEYIINDDNINDDINNEEDFEYYYDPPADTVLPIDKDTFIDIDDDDNNEHVLGVDNEGENHNVYVDTDNSSDDVGQADGDNDGIIDYFIDTDDDNVADVYWDPDDKISSDIISEDVDEDKTNEWIFGVEKGVNDRYYDPDDKLVKFLEKKEVQSFWQWLIAQIKKFIDINRDLLNKITISSLLAPILYYLAVSPSPRYVFSIFKDGLAAILFWKKRRESRDWGIVYDVKSGKPIPFVAVKIIDTHKGKVSEVKVTDRFGSFLFLVSPGTYQLNAFKNGYELTSDSNANISGAFYGNPYNNEIIEVNDFDRIGKDIAMQETGRFSIPVLLSKRIFVFLLNILFFFGFAISLLITMFYPNLLNIFILVVYFYLAFIQNIMLGKVKWGTITTGDNKPVSFSMVNLFNDHGRKVARVVSDERGRYFMIANKGRYLLNATAMSGGEKNREINLRRRGSIKENLVI